MKGDALFSWPMEMKNLQVLHLTVKLTECTVDNVFNIKAQIEASEIVQKLNRDP